MRCFLDIVMEEVADGKCVKIVDFGRFEKYVSKPTTRYDFRTNEVKLIGERSRIRFKPFKSFKEGVDEKS